MAGAVSPRVAGIVLVFFAAVLWSTAGLFMRALPLDLWTILFWRSLAGAASLFLLAAIESRRGVIAVFRSQDKVALIFVPLSAAGMICYIAALRLTTVADVMIIYATLPFCAVGVSWLWGRERPSPPILIASGVALAGVAIMVTGSRGPNRLLGDLFVFLMNIEFAFLMVMARRRPTRSMTPSNAMASLLCAVVAAFVAPSLAVDGRQGVLLALFGFVSIGLALALYMAGARRLPAAEAGLVGLVDVILGPLWVWWAFQENPGGPALLGGTVVASAVVWSLVWQARKGRPEIGRVRIRTSGRSDIP